jgi:hypothetical protein
VFLVRKGEEMTIPEALELASTTQLYDELQKRFDHLVFAGAQMRPMPNKPDNENRMRRFKGHPHLCVGLAFDLASSLHKGIADQEVAMPAEDL